MEKLSELPQASSRPVNPEPVSWKVAALAGIPALLFPLAYIIPILVLALVPVSWQAWFGFVLIIPFLVILVGGVTWVWKLGWPRWSGGWLAWGWLSILFPPVLLLQMWNKPFGNLLSEFYFRVVPFTAIALLLFRTMRKDPLKGILAALPLMNIFWLPHLEFVPEVRKGVVVLVTWLIIALVSVLIMKLGQVRYGVVLALLATFLVAFPYTYAANYLRVFSADTPADVIAHQADFSDLTYYFAPTLAGCFAVLLGPLLACELWRLSKRNYEKGRLAFRLAFVGLLLNFIGNLVAISRISFVGFLRSFVTSLPTLITGLAYLGLVLYWFGAFRVVRLSRQSQGTPSMLVSILLVLIPAFLPMFAMYPAWFGLVAVPPQAPFGFLHLERVRYLAYGVGLAVLVAGGWLAAQLNKKESDSGSRAGGFTHPGID